MYYHRIILMKTLKELMYYMGQRKALLPLSMFLSVLSELAGLLPYILIWLIVRELLSDGNFASSQHIIFYARWAAGMAIGGIILYFLALTCSHLAAFRVESNLRKEAMCKIVKMPLGFFDTNTSGRIRKIIDDNASITHSFLAHQLPDLSGTILVPAITILLIGIFNWQLGLACIVPVVIAMFIMGYTMNTKGKEFMRAYMTSLEDMNTEAVEYVRGIPVVKVFQQTIYSFKNFYKSIMNYNQMVSSYTGMWEKPMSFYTIIINSFVFFLTPLAILLIGNTGHYTPVLLDFFLFVLITPVFSQSIMKSMYLSQALGQAQEALGRLNRFTILQGQRIALVGASGSGKTTIARLIPRFWDTKEGQVLIGGTNVKDISQETLMKNISFVFQNPRLFKTTLLENIAYGNPYADGEAINRAIDMAQCREIVDRLPQGLNTKIGTEGTYLSGGEQQRIVLARAILKNAPIIVLDEATAFADPENEHKIQKALKELTAGKTVLMIAHRLSSITNADNIIVIDKGRIMEQGTHHELIDKHGMYSKMWKEYQQSVNWIIGKEVSYE